MGVFNYFAYGSNMPSARLRARCSSARALARAVVHGHELRWHKASKDGSGKCDLFPTEVSSSAVHGVIYQIDASELPSLDRAEGRGYGYERVELEVTADGRAQTVITYKATKTDSSLKPYSWYHAFVVLGAREHGLPDEYIANLEAVATDIDPDPVRHDEMMALIGEASS